MRSELELREALGHSRLASEVRVDELGFRFHKLRVRERSRDRRGHLFLISNASSPNVLKSEQVSWSRFGCTIQNGPSLRQAPVRRRSSDWAERIARSAITRFTIG
jgi:hypothetical protein